MPCGQMTVSAAYPNPVFFAGDTVKFNLLTSCPENATWTVFTPAYRLVYSETVLVNGPKTVAWDMKDKKNASVAGGLYFIQVKSGKTELKTLKVLVQY
jgi:hypothetical protein